MSCHLWAKITHNETKRQHDEFWKLTPLWTKVKRHTREDNGTNNEGYQEWLCVVSSQLLPKIKHTEINRHNEKQKQQQQKTSKSQQCLSFSKLLFFYPLNRARTGDVKKKIIAWIFNLIKKIILNNNKMMKSFVFLSCFCISLFFFLSLFSL